MKILKKYIFLLVITNLRTVNQEILYTYKRIYTYTDIILHIKEKLR